MKLFLISILIVLLSHYMVQAQMCKGKVIEFETGKPIRYANVFLAGTLIGTTSDQTGNFEFDTKGNLGIPLIVSYVGFETRVLPFNYLKSDSIVRLKKEIFDIREIRVKSKSSNWSRSRMLRVFKEEFLGKSFNAQSCKIINETDIYLYYNDSSKILHAHSSKPIIIENKLLNYRILYLLEYFQKASSGIKFKGYSSFREMRIKNENQKKKIEENRKQAYLGSILHFMRYLYNYNMAANDTIYDIDVITSMYSYRGYDTRSLSNNHPGDLSVTVKLSKNEINNVVIREYRNKFQLYDFFDNYLSPGEILIDSAGVRKLCYDKNIRILYLGNLRNSHLVPRADCFEISQNGYYDPESVGWFGLMSKFRVGDLLPYDFIYKENVSTKKYLFE